MIDDVVVVVVVAATVVGSDVVVCQAKEKLMLEGLCGSLLVHDFHE